MHKLKKKKKYRMRGGRSFLFQSDCFVSVELVGEWERSEGKLGQLEAVQGLPVTSGQPLAPPRKRKRRRRVGSGRCGVPWKG